MARGGRGHLAGAGFGGGQGRSAEIGGPEGLADGGMFRLAPLRLRKRDSRLRGHAELKLRASLLEEAVRGFAHDPR